jgi:hypothetical protein
MYTLPELRTHSGYDKQNFRYILCLKRMQNHYKYHASLKHTHTHTHQVTNDRR